MSWLLGKEVKLLIIFLRLNSVWLVDSHTACVLDMLDEVLNQVEDELLCLFMLFCHLLIFLKFLSGIPSEGQTVCIQTRDDPSPNCSQKLSADGTSSKKLINSAR